MLDTDIDGSRANYAVTTGDDKGKPVDNANGKMVKDFKDTLPADFTLSEVIGVGNNTDRFVKVKMKGGGEIEIDITKPNYADKIKDFIMKSQENEAGVKTQALATQGKKQTITTKTTGRGNSNTPVGSPATPVNPGGVGGQYNGTP